MSVQPTRPSALGAVFVLAASFGWSVIRLWSRWSDEGPSVPWLAAVTMTLLFLSLLGWALVARNKIQPEPGKPRWHPLVAARTVALAMAASRVGSLAAGFYFGFLMASLDGFSSPAGRQRVLVSGVIVLASVGTVVVALWLERICQLPQPPASATSDEAAGSSA